LDGVLLGRCGRGGRALRLPRGVRRHAAPVLEPGGPAHRGLHHRPLRVGARGAAGSRPNRGAQRSSPHRIAVVRPSTFLTCQKNSPPEHGVDASFASSVLISSGGSTVMVSTTSYIARSESHGTVHQVSLSSKHAPVSGVT